MDLASRKIVIIGLGYLGLPLAVAFGATRDVVGFDINQSRVDALERGEDHTLEASSDEIRAAKVIENTQRDLNIALMNELSLIFGKLGIDTSEVLETAGTKWNVLRFTPGLVGGHCIGVDPYYLTHKALELGYHPEVILAGRRIKCVRAFGITSMKDIPDGRYDGVIVAVGHRQFRALGVDGLQALCKTPGVIYDIKGLFPRHVTDGRFR
ncbi:hypothetical protein NKI73_00935 [Mesorhizobium sp. M0496]